MGQVATSPATRRKWSGTIGLGAAVCAVIVAFVGSLLARKLPGPGCHEAEYVGQGTALMYLAFLALGPAAVIAGMVAAVVGPTRNRVLGLAGGLVGLGVMVILWARFDDWTYWCGY